MVHLLDAKRTHARPRRGCRGLVNPSRGHGRVLHGQGYSLALVLALVLVAPKGGLLPTNQIATVGRFRW